MPEMATINWLAVLLAGVVNMALGAAWYAPALFGKSWMEEMKIKEAKPNPVIMFQMFVVALVIAAFFSQFIGWLGADTFLEGLEIGALAGFTFVVLSGASSTLASGTSWKLWGINAGYWFVAFALMGGVLAAL